MIRVRVKSLQVRSLNRSIGVRDGFTRASEYAGWMRFFFLYESRDQL